MAERRPYDICCCFANVMRRGIVGDCRSRDRLEPLGLLAFERLERHDDVGVVPFARDRRVDAQVLNRAFDLVA